MADEAKLRKAQQAQELLNSEMFKEIMAALKADCFDEWTKSQPQDSQMREDMYFLNVALAHIENRLQSYVDEGKLEEYIPIEGSEA